MKMFKLAVGFAAGYVLGTRAGREKYEQIAASARKAAAHPTVVQAQEKAKGLLNTGVEKTNAKLASVADKDTAAAPRETSTFPKETAAISRETPVTPATVKPRPAAVPPAVKSEPLV